TVNVSKVTSIHQVLDVIDEEIGFGTDDDLHGSALGDDAEGTCFLEGAFVHEVLVADFDAQTSDACLDLIDVVRAAEAGDDLLRLAHNNHLHVPHSRTGAGVLFCDGRHKSTATRGHCRQHSERVHRSGPDATRIGGTR